MPDQDQPKATVRVFDAFYVDGVRHPRRPERIYVDLSGPVDTEPVWKCVVWIDPTERSKLDAADRAELLERIDAVGVFAFTELFEWELTDDELFNLDRFSKRGVEIVLPAVADAAHRFAMMPGSIGLQTDLARSPLFSPGAGPGDMQLALSSPTVVGSLYHKPFAITAPAGWLTVRDGLLLCELVRMYVDQGFPESRAVAVTVAGVCDAAGYSDKGGWQFNRASDALMRLRSATLRNIVRLEDGAEEHYTWGLIDAGWMRSGLDGGGQIRLSEELAGLIRRGLIAYYDRATLRGLIDDDEYAARLWMFLESERLGEKRRLYSIFSAPEGQPPAERDTPAIADLLGMSDWTRRRKVKDRIGVAGAAITAADHRYLITVDRAKRRTMWNLCVVKSAGVRLGALTNAEAVDNTVDNFGSEVYGQGRESVRPGAQRCTARGANVEEIPASHERNEKVPSVLPSDRSSVDLDLKDTGFQENPRESEQRPERHLGEGPCSPAAIVAGPSFGSDTLDIFADLFDADLDLVLEAVAATVCGRFRNASGGACCREAAERDDEGNVNWCPAWDAFSGVILKLTNYIAKRGQVKGSPAAYVNACIKRAAADPTEMMGRTREESKAAYRAMIDLNAHAKIPADFAYKLKRMT